MTEIIPTRVIRVVNHSNQGDPRQGETSTGVWNHCQGSRAKRHREMEVSIENYRVIKEDSHM